MSTPLTYTAFIPEGLSEQAKQVWEQLGPSVTTAERQILLAVALVAWDRARTATGQLAHDSAEQFLSIWRDLGLSGAPAL